MVLLNFFSILFWRTAEATPAPIDLAAPTVLYKAALKGDYAKVQWPQQQLSCAAARVWHATNNKFGARLAPVPVLVNSNGCEQH